ncbi:MAG: 16S rRNA methyltransferase [Roseiflexus sp.]|nr:16S rRNA methyltransferase [Roseiflexus sp.]MCS7290903.1 16S rRNA methyltransferase [Roseiflexus sp.]MDW8146269.1 16S rRNA methyltransferase [Roseiflexaceae bacterium]MDW8232717.1 16S rRNA methyltransferase [Roseiflexaceae bacterium]
MSVNTGHSSSERLASPDASQIDEVVATVLAAPKYRTIAPSLVRTLAMRELAARRSVKAAIKATKNKLHQVAGAYVEQRIDVADWLRRLQSHDASSPSAAPDDALVQAALANSRVAHLGESFVRASLDLMARHASTRERLPIVQQFYADIFACLPPIRSVLDVGCGLNPLAIPWMPLAPNAVYHASDIDRAIVDFIARYLTLLGIPGSVEVRDQVSDPGGPPVDLALALKMLPVLEQIERGAAARLLDALDASFVLVSYPVHTLGGRRKGMGATYERQLEALVAGREWEVRRFIFPGELAFLIRKGSRQSWKSSASSC